MAFDPIRDQEVGLYSLQKVSNLFRQGANGYRRLKHLENVHAFVSFSQSHKVFGPANFPHPYPDFLSSLSERTLLRNDQVKLEALANREALVVATGLTAAAIVGKLAAGLACSPKVNRLVVGIGMIPRGEVGLIFVSVGKGLGIVTDAVFSAVVMMVMVTTILTPPLLKIALEYGGAKRMEKAAP